MGRTVSAKCICLSPNPALGNVTIFGDRLSGGSQENMRPYWVDLLGGQQGTDRNQGKTMGRHKKTANCKPSGDQKKPTLPTPLSSRNREKINFGCLSAPAHGTWFDSPNKRTQPPNPARHSVGHFSPLRNRAPLEGKPLPAMVELTSL